MCSKTGGSGSEDLWPASTISRRISEAADPAAALTAVVASRVTRPDLALRAVLAQLQAGSSVAGDGRGGGLDQQRAAPPVPGSIRLWPLCATPHPPIPDGTAVGRAGNAFRDRGRLRGLRRPAHLAREVRALAGVPLSQLVTVGQTDPR
jgi:hypothetical protein